MPFQNLDLILGTQTKVQLLRALAQLTSPVSGREAQRLAGVRSTSAGGRALDDLTDLGILTRDEAGGTHLYLMNRDHALAEPLLRLFEAESRLFSRLRELIIEGLEARKVRDRVDTIVIFGSAARGEARPDSDVDLFVVVEDEAAVRSVRDGLLASDDRLRTGLGLRVSPYVLSRKDVENRYRDGDPLMETIKTEGRTLVGDPFEEVIGAW